MFLVQAQESNFTALTWFPLRKIGIPFWFEPPQWSRSQSCSWCFSGLSTFLPPRELVERQPRQSRRPQSQKPHRSDPGHRLKCSGCRRTKGQHFVPEGSESPPPWLTVKPPARTQRLTRSPRLIKINTVSLRQWHACKVLCPKATLNPFDPPGSLIYISNSWSIIDNKSL